MVLFLPSSSEADLLDVRPVLEETERPKEVWRKGRTVCGQVQQVHVSWQRDRQASRTLGRLGKQKLSRRGSWGEVMELFLHMSSGNQSLRFGGVETASASAQTRSVTD